MGQFGFGPEGEEECAQGGMTISSELQEQYHSAQTVSVTRSVQLSWDVIVASDPQDTTEAQAVWRAVARALGELQMSLLGPATPTASRSTQS